MKYVQNLAAFAAAATLFQLVTPANAAVTWNEIQFSGFLSQGYIKSSANDYLGTESSDGDFDLREYAISASRRFGSQWRVGAQVFAQKLGHFGDDKATLDWAIVDYNVSQSFGLRAGRVKLPRGLYNEALDLDAARVCAVLPQALYDLRLRDQEASVDGAMAYGNLSFGKAGSVDYKAFYGARPMDTEGGVSDLFNDEASSLYTDFGCDASWGTSVFWSHPDLALRVGYSFNRLENIHGERPLGGPYKVSITEPWGYDVHLFSVEYVTGDWTFAAEYTRHKQKVLIDVIIPDPYTYTLASKKTGWYAMVSRRINDRWDVGCYYSASTGAADLPDGKDHQNDAALSVRFNATQQVILKAEAHFVNGTYLIADRVDAPQPLAERDNTWNYLVLKATTFF